MAEDAKTAELILNKYLEFDYYNKAKIIFAYFAMNKEICVHRVIDRAFTDNKKVALPKIRTSVKDGANMDFVFIEKNTKFKAGVFGILEPISEKPTDVCNAGEKIEMLIPGLCFDLKRNRIGYGGGYFDRYLTKFPDLFHITALAYEYQIFEE